MNIARRVCGVLNADYRDSHCLAFADHTHTYTHIQYKCKYNSYDRKNSYAKLLYAGREACETRPSVASPRESLSICLSVCTAVGLCLALYID